MYYRNLTTLVLLPVLTIFLLFGCSDNLEEVTQKLDEQNEEWKRNHPAGIRIEFSSDVSTLNSDATVMVKLTADGKDHEMTVSAKEA